MIIFFFHTHMKFIYDSRINMEKKWSYMDFILIWYEIHINIIWIWKTYEVCWESYRAHINLVRTNFILTFYMNFMVRTLIPGYFQAIILHFVKNSVKIVLTVKFIYKVNQRWAYTAFWARKTNSHIYGQAVQWSVHSLSIHTFFL